MVGKLLSVIYGEALLEPRRQRGKRIDRCGAYRPFSPIGQVYGDKVAGLALYMGSDAACFTLAEHGVTLPVAVPCAVCGSDGTVTDRRRAGYLAPAVSALTLAVFPFVAQQLLSALW